MGQKESNLSHGDFLLSIAIVGRVGERGGTGSAGVAVTLPMVYGKRVLINVSH